MTTQVTTPLDSDEAAWTARPVDTQSLQVALRDARAEATPVWIHGAGTDIRPCQTEGAWVGLDMRGMDTVHTIDRRSRVVRVDSGITIGALSQALADVELTLDHLGPLPADATVGGLLGRSHVWPATFGHPGLVESVVGLTAWFDATSRYHYLPAPRKASGPDLRHVFIGAEGRSGVISEVWLSVAARPMAQGAWAAEVTTESVVPTLQRVSASGIRPWRLEARVVSDGHARLVMEVAGGTELVHGWRARVASLGDAWGATESSPGLADASLWSCRVAGAWATVARGLQALPSGCTATVLSRGPHGAEVTLHGELGDVADLDWLGCCERSTVPATGLVELPGAADSWLPAAGSRLVPEPGGDDG